MNAVIKVDGTGKLGMPADVVKALGFGQGEEFVVVKANASNQMAVMLLPKYQPSQPLSKKLTLEIEHDPETAEYVVACPELDLATAAESREEAITDLVEAIEEYVQDYLERLDLFASSPNRSTHLPWILLIARCTSPTDIRGLLATPPKGMG